MFGKIKKFINEVISELKKVSWTAKKDLIDSTWVVVVSSFFLGCFIAICDFVLSKLLGILIR